ncbi:MAG: segregation/condensation protein A, partial [Planctomycetota bacterium]
MVSGDFTVRLEQVFQGPMDLLLHLVREQEVEIHEIEIAKILDGYLAYLEALEELDVEFAGDFLVMAASLMAIKSRSLLPREEVNLEEELDPRDELIQRLLEYRRFREAADGLETAWNERVRQVPRGWRGEVEETAEREFELGELTIWDLFSVYSRLLRETEADRPQHIAGDPHPLRFYVD